MYRYTDDISQMENHPPTIDDQELVTSDPLFVVTSPPQPPTPPAQSHQNLSDPKNTNLLTNIVVPPISPVSRALLDYRPLSSYDFGFDEGGVNLDSFRAPLKFNDSSSNWFESGDEDVKSVTPEPTTEPNDSVNADEDVYSFTSVKNSINRLLHAGEIPRQYKATPTFTREVTPTLEHSLRDEQIYYSATLRPFTSPLSKKKSSYLSNITNKDKKDSLNDNDANPSMPMQTDRNNINGQCDKFTYRYYTRETTTPSDFTGNINTPSHKASPESGTQNHSKVPVVHMPSSQQHCLPNDNQNSSKLNQTQFKNNSLQPPYYQHPPPNCLQPMSYTYPPPPALSLNNENIGYEPRHTHVLPCPPRKSCSRPIKPSTPFAPPLDCHDVFLKQHRPSCNLLQHSKYNPPPPINCSTRPANNQAYPSKPTDPLPRVSDYKNNPHSSSCTENPKCQLHSTNCEQPPSKLTAPPIPPSIKYPPSPKYSHSRYQCPSSNVNSPLTFNDIPTYAKSTAMKPQYPVCQPNDQVQFHKIPPPIPNYPEYQTPTPNANGLSLPAKSTQQTGPCSMPTFKFPPPPSQYPRPTCNFRPQTGSSMPHNVVRSPIIRSPSQYNRPPPSFTFPPPPIPPPHFQNMTPASSQTRPNFPQNLTTPSKPVTNTPYPPIIPCTPVRASVSEKTFPRSQPSHTHLNVHARKFVTPSEKFTNADLQLDQGSDSGNASSNSDSTKSPYYDAPNLYATVPSARVDIIADYNSDNNDIGIGESANSSPIKAINSHNIVKYNASLMGTKQHERTHFNAGSAGKLAVVNNDQYDNDDIFKNMQTFESDTIFARSKQCRSNMKNTHQSNVQLPVSQQTENIRESRQICTFCKSIGRPEEEYRSHRLKNTQKKVTCPILYKNVCPICNVQGDYAHTSKHCPERNTKKKLTKTAYLY